MSKIGVYVVNKEEGISERTKKNWYKVTMVPVIAPEVPFLIGKTLNKYVSFDTYAGFEVNPTALLEVEVDIKNAYKPENADLHLSVNLVEEVAQ